MEKGVLDGRGREEREDHHQHRAGRSRPDRSAGRRGLLRQPHRLHPHGHPAPARQPGGRGERHRGTPGADAGHPAPQPPRSRGTAGRRAADRAARPGAGHRSPTTSAPSWRWRRSRRSRSSAPSGHRGRSRPRSPLEPSEPPHRRRPYGGTRQHHRTARPIGRRRRFTSPRKGLSHGRQPSHRHARSTATHPRRAAGRGDRAPAAHVRRRASVPPTGGQPGIPGSRSAAVPRRPPRTARRASRCPTSAACSTSSGAR